MDPQVAEEGLSKEGQEGSREDSGTLYHWPIIEECVCCRLQHKQPRSHQGYDDDEEEEMINYQIFSLGINSHLFSKHIYTHMYRCLT